MDLKEKIIIGLLTAAIVGLFTDHIIVRGNLQEEIERSKIIDEKHDQWLLNTSNRGLIHSERISKLEAEIKIRHE